MPRQTTHAPRPSRSARGAHDPSALRPRLAAFLAAIALLMAAPGAAQEGLAIGDRPAPVVLETLDGEPVDLADLIGTRPVLLEFWATWCAVCRALEPSLRAAHEAYGDEVEFVIVAAAVNQTPDRIRAHLARHPLPGRMLWDTQGRFTRGFDAPGTGYIVILDADGAVAYAGTGPGQDLVPALARVVDGISERSQMSGGR